MTQFYKAFIQFKEADNTGTTLDIIYTANDKKEAIKSAYRFGIARIKNLDFFKEIIAIKVYHYYIYDIEKDGEYNTGMVGFFFEWKCDDRYNIEESINQKIYKKF